MINNLSRKTKIAIDAKICESALSKAVGLMFSREQNKVLVFKFNHEKIVPLHMLFVFYSIDVLFLNEERAVVELKENFKPFTFCTPKKKVMYVVELPQSSIKKLKAEVGDKIEF